MVLNLLNDKQFNSYLTDIVYQGDTVPQQQSYSGEFESPDYVEQHRDEIIKGILNQYIKLRLRQYVLTLKDEPAFEIVDKNRSDLPGWTEQTFARGENIYEFDGAKMSQKLRDEITMIRDFLYDEAGMYVDKVVKTARETKKKPKIRYDYLKTTNEYDTFEKVLAAAKHWHENMAAEIAKRKKGRELLQKSLVGVEHVMDLKDGMSVFQLKTEEALDFESEYMGHCVGKGGYDKGVKDNTAQIYSIRDERGEPHVTFEVRDGKIYQCKGKSNKRPIKKYIPVVQEFISRQKLNPEHDLFNMGLINVDEKIYNIYNLPKELDVRGNLNLSHAELDELPDLSHWIVHGDFYCQDNNLTNLRGAPQRVDGKFDCSNNKLTSLDGAPQSVGGDFYCQDNNLTDLNGAPKHVGGKFVCSNNKLTSLEGAPQRVSKGFHCQINKLTSLDGAPQSVGGDFYCSNNRLVNLEGGPQSVGGDFHCQINNLTDLNGAPKHVGGKFDCSNNRLVNLEGGPQRVSKGFYCRNNKLTSLDGAPQSVGGDFYCQSNDLTNLNGGPQSVGGDFNCSNNQLVNLEGAPQSVGGNFNCSYNKLTSLNGAPQSVNGYFDCRVNKLVNLKGAPQYIGSEKSGIFDCSYNKLTSLDGAPKKVPGSFDCSNNKLTSLDGAPKKVGILKAHNNPVTMRNEEDIYEQDEKIENKVSAFKHGIIKIKSKFAELAQLFGGNANE